MLGLDSNKSHSLIRVSRILACPEVPKCPVGCQLTDNEVGCPACECRKCSILWIGVLASLADIAGACLSCYSMRYIRFALAVALSTSQRFAFLTFSITAPLPLNICLHPKDPGDCAATFNRAWYDISDNTCKQFSYTGCKGNGNNFATIAECEQMCIGKRM